MMLKIECPQRGDDKATLQGHQLGPMQARQLVEQLTALVQQANFDPPSVLCGTSTFDQAQLFAARDQCDDAVMMGLQSLREFSDGGPITAWIASNLQQQQILLRFDSVPQGELLAESNEFANLIAEIRKGFEIAFAQGAGVRFRHGATIKLRISQGTLE